MGQSDSTAVLMPGEGSGYSDGGTKNIVFTDQVAAGIGKNKIDLDLVLEYSETQPERIWQSLVYCRKQVRLPGTMGQQ